MRQLFTWIIVLTVGALVLSPAVAIFDLDPVPGDINFRLGTAHIVIPVLYSLCASLGLALFYKIMRR